MNPDKWKKNWRDLVFHYWQEGSLPFPSRLRSIFWIPCWKGQGRSQVLLGHGHVSFAPCSPQRLTRGHCRGDCEERNSQYLWRILRSPPFLWFFYLKISKADIEMWFLFFLLKFWLVAHVVGLKHLCHSGSKLYFHFSKSSLPLPSKHYADLHIASDCSQTQRYYFSPLAAWLTAFLKSYCLLNCTAQTPNQKKAKHWVTLKQK